MASSLSQEITKVFGEAVASNENLMSECISMCQIYNLKPDDLLWKLEALNFRPSATRSEISPVTIESITALKAQIQRDMAKGTVKKAQPKIFAQNAVINRSRLPPNMLGRQAPVPSETPGNIVKEEIEQKASIPQMINPSVRYLGPKSGNDSSHQRFYRYMFEKISERSEVLDQMIDDFGELIREHYEITELGDPSSSTDEEIYVAGRIARDIDSASSSKLTESSMFIESSRMLAAGARVPLRFDPALRIRGATRGAGGIGLFPGALVAMKGKNGGGGYFLATEILAMPPPKVCSQDDMAMKVDGDIDNSMTVVVACGPFTSESDLEYKPWKSLLKYLKTAKPKVLLIIGPFVDAIHPKIKEGDTDSTPTSLFHTQFTRPLRSFLDTSPGSIALLVPNVRDLVSTHAVFPQSELSSELLDSDSRILLLPNPARFSLNDISFATCSVDTLFHLRKEEFFKRGAEIGALNPSPGDTGSDPMANLCRHLLQQRSFYPLFPTPDDLSHETNLDITHSNSLKLIDADFDYAPDILILPSRLKQFSKTLYTTTAINPSYLSKGTYATLNISRSNTPGNLRDRMAVEISKLDL